MRTISVHEAKTRFSSLLEQVARGEEIVITHHDAPIARIVPEGRRSKDRIKQVAQELRQLQELIAETPEGSIAISDTEIRAAVNEGRS